MHNAESNRKNTIESFQIQDIVDKQEFDLTRILENDDDAIPRIGLNSKYIDISEIHEEMDTFANQNVIVHLNIRSLPLKFDLLKMLLNNLNENHISDPGKR